MQMGHVSFIRGRIFRVGGCAHSLDHHIRIFTGEEKKMKNLHRNILILIILAAAALSGCARKEAKPYRMPDVRTPDISKAIEIPHVPYPVIPNELVVLLKEDRSVE